MKMASATVAATLSLMIVFMHPFSSCSQLLPQSDIDVFEFALNFAYLEAEFFLGAATGSGLDVIAPSLAGGGPPPLGVRKAALDLLTRDVIRQFGYIEVGHIRVLKNTVKGFPRPLLNLTSGLFAQFLNGAFGRTLVPPFDPYANSINFLIVSYAFPYVGLTGYVGANPRLQTPTAKALAAKLLAIASGKDAVIRTLLYQNKDRIVLPYKFTVAEFTNRISNLTNALGNQGVKSEGLIVSKIDGAEGSIEGNVLVGDKDSLAYPRTERELLRVAYATGNERAPGGFFPNGAKGRIATSFLQAA